MKIGILNSDTVQIDGAKDFGQYPEMFSKIFWKTFQGIDQSLWLHLFAQYLNSEFQFS